MMKSLAALVVVLTASLAAQSFEVASIKRNVSGTGFRGIGMQPNGQLTFTNVPVRQMIVRAYGVQPYQIVGGPGWISSDAFDVIAKAPAGASIPADINPMLQSLLADRFKLKVHRETRQADVYNLVKARTDGKLGPELKPAAVDCSPGRGRGAPPPPGGEPGAGPGRGPAIGAGCQVMIAPGRFIVGGQPLSALVTVLGQQLGRPVIDQTGVTGNFDFTVTFLPEGGRGLPAGPAPPGAPELPPIDPNAPSLFTALQEQLGFKLEGAKGPVEFIVIDSIEQPTED